MSTTSVETPGYLGHTNPEYEYLALNARDIGQQSPLGYSPTKLEIPEGKREHWHDLWAAPDAQADLHVWTATPGEYIVDGADRPNLYEVTAIMRGRATVVEEGKEPVELSAGDTFVCPPGWSGVWHVHEYVEKSFFFVYV